MSRFVTGRVTVDVPATSANLGPGFDSFGLALDLHDTLAAEVAGDGLVIEVSGEGAGEVPLDERHLVVRAMRAAFDEMGVHPDGLAVSCTNRIPHSRGLGSSSAAIVGGISLAVALVANADTRLGELQMLQLATELEGHPDNAAPALLGGFVIAGTTAGTTWAHPIDVPVLDLVVFVPPDGVRTDIARGLLPETVSHRDAAANSARAALLALGLRGDRSLLLAGTEEFLHQLHREPAMPHSMDLVRRLRAAGVPAVISGAGPSVLAFVPGSAGRAAESELEEVLGHTPTGWQGSARTLAEAGVRVSRA